MTKKQINQLVIASYAKDELDNKSIDKIVSFLSRADLKQYIRAVKLSEKARTVSLVLPNAKLYNNNKKFWQDIFKNKKIIVEEDASLLLGIKVISNDMVYDMTLKNTLDSLAKEITK